MKRLNILFAAVAMFATAVCALAAESTDAGADAAAPRKKTKSEIVDHLKNNYRFYGFIRTYMPFDTHESYAGSGDLFYWIPKDRELNDRGEDVNERASFRMLSLTSRLGVDVSGYWIGDNEFGGKVEADFYAGLSGSTGVAQLRLRQAYVTVNWLNPEDTRYSINFKGGQAWHPMAADLPDVLALDTGMPFGPFSRTPQLTTDFNFGKKFSVTVSAIWQMQYTSMGPSAFDAKTGRPTAAASSADYIKYGIVPEFYLGLSYRSGGFLGRIGADVTSIRPRGTATVGGTKVKVKDRSTSVLAFMYLQYTKNLFKFKAKTTYGGAGEHLNLMSGYAVSSISSDNSLWEYTPIRTSSTWMTLAYGKKLQGSLLLGYVKNFGTAKDIVANAAGKGDGNCIFFQKNGSANINQMYRIEPGIAYNVGRFTVGLEYMLTAVQYGDKEYDLRAMTTGGLHWVANHRVEGMVRFTF
ncbi:MAG: hypothetical protein MJY49_00145 [Bacteroidales bacterium]|nr:hypothetical protein [Bacteroidales bacterium]